MARLTKTRNRFATGFPDATFTKLKYFENSYRFDLGIGAILNNIVMSGNGPYDPYIATGGKSALFYDQYMSVYRWCRVNAVKITVTINKLSDTNNSFIFALLPRPVSDSVFTDMDDVCAQPRVRIMRMTPNRVGNTQKMSIYIPVHVILQMTKQQYKNIIPSASYDGTRTSSPSTAASIDIYWGRTDENSSSAAVNFEGTIKMVYYVKCYQRNTIIQLGADIGDTVLDTGEEEKPGEEYDP